MGRPKLPPTTVVRTRLDDRDLDVLRDRAERAGLSLAATMRALVRAELYPAELSAPPKPKSQPVAPLRRRAARRRNSHRQSPPDPIDHTYGHLAALRVPVVGRHDYVPQAAGPPRCAACGATPEEDVSCR